MRAVALILALLAMTGAARADISGLPVALARPGIRYVVVGELHGTEELPAFFGDLVAEISARRPVAVVLEYPEQWRRDIETYLASSGDEAARKKLQATDFWQKWHDGRSSRAMFALVEKLRTLQVPVTACQPSGSAGDPGSYERVMGECWKEAAAALKERSEEESKPLTLIFVGNAHASYTPVFGDYLPAASYLPREETVSLDNLTSPGDAWNCLKDKPCGANALVAPGTPHPRAIYFGQDLLPQLGTYDGVYSAGPKLTASPPVVGTP